MYSFKLVGSRSRGKERPDSDWDVMLDIPPIWPDGAYWSDISVDVVQSLGGWTEVERIAECARAFIERIGAQPGAQLDVFVPIDWGVFVAVLLKWDEDLQCLAGGWQSSTNHRQLEE